jgi:hypothetical protein
VSQNPLQEQSSGHNRIHERLVDYWNSLRAGRAFPKESEIDPSQIHEIWNSCFLIQNKPDTKEKGYRYAYLGVDLIDAWGDDLSSQEISSRLINPSHENFVKKFDEVIATKAPLVDESEFVNTRRIKIKYRTCMLPLGNAPDSVEFIIGGMKWKAY